jgi:hypothetical protein
LISGIKWILREKQPKGIVLFLLLVGLITLGWGVGNGYSGNEIQIVVRFFYFLQVSLFAFLTSWILFPQTSMWLTQSLNPTLSEISKILFGRTVVMTIGSIIFLGAAILGAQDVDFGIRIFVLIDVLIFSSGLTVFAMSRFLRIGSNSQLWQEGRKGVAFMNYMKEAGSGGAGVPSGAVPTIMATSLVAIIGMMSIVFQSWVQGVSGLFIPGIAGLVLLVPGLRTVLTYLPTIDSEFYHSHGFYNELFRNPGGRADGGREPIPIASLYWVPFWLKPATWLTFRQLDRKLPLGRLLVLIFIVYWGLIKASILDSQALILLPIVIIAAKNMVLFAIDNQSYSSLWYSRTFGSGVLWFGVHVATGIRWLIPVQFFLALTVWFVQDLTQDQLVTWITLDLAIILGISGVRTAITSFNYAKNYK